ncbi:Farnesyl pyrophosphate synthase 1 [Bienertia sinuspersici]
MSDLRSTFLDVYQVLISELFNDPAIELSGFSRLWVDNIFANFFSDFSLQAYFLYLGSILEKSHTRPDQDCWFTEFKVRMFAAQDGVIFQQRIQRVLKKHFREKKYYADLLDLINEVRFSTNYPQRARLLLRYCLATHFSHLK